MADPRVIQAEYRKFLGISFALHGLLPPSTSEYFVFQRVERESPIPSPFAQTLVGNAEYRRSLQNDHSWVMSAFDQIKRMKLSNLKSQPLSHDGCLALFGMILKRKKGHSQVATGQASTFSFPAGIEHDQLLIPILYGGKERPLLIRRANPRYGTQTCYYLVNIRFENLYVNGQHVSEGTVLGPLPDFAIIACGGFAIFWWKTIDAFDYDPGSSLAPSTGQPGNDSSDKTSGRPNPGATGSQTPRPRPSRRPSTKSGPKSGQGEPASQKVVKSAGPPNSRTLSTPWGPSQTWARVYQEGLSRHRSAQSRAKSPKDQAHRIPQVYDLSEEDLIFAIGSIWAAVHTRGRRFAFAGMDFFTQDENTPAEARLRRIGVVGGPFDFIMPILLHPQRRKGATPVDQTKSIGHIVLCCARLSDPFNSVFDLDIYDSAPGLVSLDEIGQTVQRLLAGADWPWYPPPEGFWRSAPIFGELRYQRVPVQHEASNTCGLHTILNAYALILGIPITNNIDCLGAVSSQEFYRQALDVINLALAGYMDSLTIMAFMSVWAYTPTQALPFSLLQGDALPPLESLPDQPTSSTEAPEGQETGTAIFQVNARRINGVALVEILQTERRFDEGRIQDHLGPLLPGNPPNASNFPSGQLSLDDIFPDPGAQDTTMTEASQNPTDPIPPEQGSGQQGYNALLEPYRSTAQAPSQQQYPPQQPFEHYAYPDPNMSNFPQWATQQTGQAYGPPPEVPQAATGSYPPPETSQLTPSLPTGYPPETSSSHTQAPAAPLDDPSTVQRLIRDPRVQAVASRLQAQRELEPLAREALRAGGGNFDVAVTEMTSALSLEELQTGQWRHYNPFGGDGTTDTASSERYDSWSPDSPKPGFQSVQLAGQTLRSGKRLQGRALASTSTSAGPTDGGGKRLLVGIGQSSRLVERLNLQQRRLQLLSEYHRRNLRPQPSAPAQDDEVRPAKKARPTVTSAAPAAAATTQAPRPKRKMPARKCKSQTRGTPPTSSAKQLARA